MVVGARVGTRVGRGRDCRVYDAIHVPCVLDSLQVAIGVIPANARCDKVVFISGARRVQGAVCNRGWRILDGDYGRANRSPVIVTVVRRADHLDGIGFDEIGWAE